MRVRASNSFVLADPGDSVLNREHVLPRMPRSRRYPTLFRKFGLTPTEMCPSCVANTGCDTGA
jgi:hypothetical protein